MDFRKLLEGNCGEANPIAKLVTHANQDYAYQENFSQLSTSSHMVPEHMNKNVMVPNTFNMDDLMDQLQNVESARSMAPLTRPQPSSSSLYNHIAVQQENAVFDNFFSLEEQNIGIQQIVNLQNNSATDSLGNRLIWHEFHPKSEQQTPLLEAEELQRLQKEIADAQEIINALEDNAEIKEKNTEVTKLESENSNDIVEHPSYLVYDKLSVEDVYGINDLGIKFNEKEHFYNFVENYVLKNSRKKYEKYRPGITQGGTDLTALNELRFSIKMALKTLSAYLVLKEEYGKVIAIASSFSHEIKRYQDHIDSYVFLMTDAYLYEHCFYQACQTLLTWLKSEPGYRDIVPPNFVMEEETETRVDKEQLRELIKIFMKAAQRNPIRPDVRVQIALAKLCEIDQDHEKSIDCYKSILSNEIDKKLSDYIWMSLGTSLSLANKPEEAIEAFMRISRSEKHNTVTVNTKIGLTHLSDGKHWLATVHLLGAVQNQIELGYKDTDPSFENALARLRLCFEVVRRDDLCEAVDRRDYEKILNYLYD